MGKPNHTLAVRELKRLAANAQRASTEYMRVAPYRRSEVPYSLRMTPEFKQAHNAFMDATWKHTCYAKWYAKTFNIAWKLV